MCTEHLYVPGGCSSRSMKGSRQSRLMLTIATPVHRLLDAARPWLSEMKGLPVPTCDPAAAGPLLPVQTLCCCKTWWSLCRAPSAAALPGPSGAQVAARGAMNTPDRFTELLGEGQRPPIQNSSLLARSTDFSARRRRAPGPPPPKNSSQFETEEQSEHGGGCQAKSTPQHGHQAQSSWPTPTWRSIEETGASHQVLPAMQRVQVAIIGARRRQSSPMNSFLQRTHEYFPT
jgi:hypothetical protein